MTEALLFCNALIAARRMRELAEAMEAEAISEMDTATDEPADPDGVAMIERINAFLDSANAK
jgi:putative heme iron utilization protein